jgi:tRNA modification GTPase
MLVANKIDKVPAQELDELKELLASAYGDRQYCMVSAKEKTNIEELRDKITGASGMHNIGASQPVVTNARHYGALSMALQAAERVTAGLRSGLPTDLVALEIRQVLHHLGEVTGGTISNDEILGNIFKNFCIGK